ncbi:MAG: hypothetical protein KAQ68_02085 [Clostridiales bacterium]|nr:hypothetical protein [Clostridiales bacterium]
MNLVSSISSFIPGFRTGVKWKMIVASIYYFIAVLFGFIINFWFALFIISIPYLIFGMINLFKSGKNSITKKLVPMVIVFSIMIWSLIISMGVYDIGDDTEKETDSDEIIEVVQKDMYIDGDYKVGKDIPAGEYLIETTTSISSRSKYSVTKDSNRYNKITGDYLTNRAYVSVENDQYLRLDYANAYPVDKIVAYEVEDNTYPAGMYKVGFDIPAGEYKVEFDLQYSSSIICSTASSFKDEYLTLKEGYEEDKTIILNDGEYLLLENCYIVVDKK